MRLFARQPETTDTHELLRRIELRDNRFRIAQSIFFALIILAMIVLLSLSYKTETANNNVLNAQTASNRTQAKEIDGLQSHIDCIVSLFGRPNRSSLVISDIENCKLTPSK